MSKLRTPHSGHFMINERFTGKCVDGIIRTFTVDDVDLSYTPGDIGDHERGLYLQGLDHAGYRYAAYVPWTHAVYARAINDTNGNPRRGWKIMNGDGTMIKFVDEGYAGTLNAATCNDEQPLPYRLGATADWVKITVTEYNALRRLS